MASKNKSSFFPVTNWAAVNQAARSDFAVSGLAQDALLRSYLPVLRSYLVRARSVSLDHVDDILQGFVAEKILRGQLFKKADPARGRFRNLVLKALNNYLASWFSKRARERCGTTEDGELPEIPVQAEQTKLFDQAWARQTVLAAMGFMREECASKGRQDVWEIFQCRVIKPAFDDLPETGYDGLVERFGFSSPREAVNLLVTAKRMYLRCLREAIRHYTGDSKAVEEELADLQRIVAGSRNLDTLMR